MGNGAEFPYRILSEENRRRGKEKPEFELRDTGVFDGNRYFDVFAENPHWRDLVLFYEYFPGETGRGVGASHQTGWTALVVNLLKRSCGDST